MIPEKWVQYDNASLLHANTSCGLIFMEYEKKTGNYIREIRKMFHESQELTEKGINIKW